MGNFKYLWLDLFSSGVHLDETSRLWSNAKHISRCKSSRTLWGLCVVCSSNDNRGHLMHIFKNFRRSFQEGDAASGKFAARSSLCSKRAKDCGVYKPIHRTLSS